MSTRLGRSVAVLAQTSCKRYSRCMAATTRPVVAVFNSSEDIIELLKFVLEQKGFIAVTGHIDELRHGKRDLAAFVEQYKPAAVLYDLIPPYDRHWAFVDHLREATPLKGIPFILTSTNAKMARELASRSEHVIEVLGRPFELDELVSAVQRATDGRDR
jgi:CheY-like chemotaxis protein